MRSALNSAARGAWGEPTRPGSFRAAGRGSEHPGPIGGHAGLRLSARLGLTLAARHNIDEDIVDLWRQGVRVQGRIGRMVGRNQRSVSRRIARLVQIGAWPFGDRPARGRAQVPVASGFTAMPIPRASAPPG